MKKATFKNIFFAIMAIGIITFAVACKKIDFPSDTPSAIKTLIIKFQKYDNLIVSEYIYKETPVYKFDYHSNISKHYIFDKKGNLLSAENQGGFTGEYSTDSVMPDFYSTAIFVRQIYCK